MYQKVTIVEMCSLEISFVTQIIYVYPGRCVGLPISNLSVSEWVSEWMSVWVTIIGSRDSTACKNQAALWFDIP